MKIRIFILVTFILYIDIFAQIPNPLRFQHQNYDSSYTRSSVLGLPNGNLLYFWVEGEGLFQSRSTDGGLNWEEPYLIAQTSIYYSTDNIASSLLDSGKISIVYRSSLPNNFYSIIFSYDNGLTWSSPIILPTGQNNIQRRQTTSINVNSSPDNGVYACYSKGFFNSGIYFIKSTNNGFTWSSEEVISKMVLFFHSWINLYYWCTKLLRMKTQIFRQQSLPTMVLPGPAPFTSQSPILMKKDHEY